MIRGIIRDLFDRTVIPARAGISPRTCVVTSGKVIFLKSRQLYEVPAFAGMTLPLPYGVGNGDCASISRNSLNSSSNVVFPP